MKTSGHFCPYPCAYTALACRARQATSCGRNSHLAREDGLIQGWHERRLSLPAAPRLAAVSRGSRPRETGLKTPPMHKQSLRLSAATTAFAVVRSFVPLFRCSIPGSPNTRTGYSARGGGYGSIRRFPVWLDGRLSRRSEAPLNEDEDYWSPARGAAWRQCRSSCPLLHELVVGECSLSARCGSGRLPCGPRLRAPCRPGGAHR